MIKIYPQKHRTEARAQIKRAGSLQVQRDVPEVFQPGYEGVSGFSMVQGEKSAMGLLHDPGPKSGGSCSGARSSGPSGPFSAFCVSVDGLGFDPARMRGCPGLVM
jgi:hypothetical protein